MVSRGRIEQAFRRRSAAIISTCARFRAGRVGGGGRRCLGQGRQLGAAGEPAARRVPDGLGESADIEPSMCASERFLLERTRGEKYATVFYCTVDSAGLLSYANAGHCAPFLVSRDGRLRKLHTSGMPVGMIEEAQLQVGADAVGARAISW